MAIPPSPLVTTISYGGPGTAIVAWTSSGDDVTSYTVALVSNSDGFTDSWPDGFTASTVLTVNGPFTSTSSLQLPVSGLAEGNTYCFYVTATNIDGTSDPGPTVCAVLQDTSTIDTTAPAPVPATIDYIFRHTSRVPPPPVQPNVNTDPLAPNNWINQNLITAPVLDSTQDVAGHVQLLYLEDLDSGDILYITPSYGGIYLNDFDPGYPEVREVISSYPDRHGSIDETKYYGARAVTLSVTCTDFIDGLSGETVTAAAWTDLVRSWGVLDRRVKIVYQTRDQDVRQMYIRPTQLGSPIVGAGVDRSVQRVTLGWKCPDGVTWSLPVSPYIIDASRPDYYVMTISGAATNTGGLNFNGVTGLNFNGLTGINFGGGGGTTANRGEVDKNTVGSVPVAPIITVRGGATQPKISISDGTTVRSKLEFSTAVGGVNLVVAPSDIMVIDVASRTAMLNPDSTGIGTNVTKYLTPPADWKNFLIKPRSSNIFNYYPVSSNAGSIVEVNYRQGFV